MIDVTAPRELFAIELQYREDMAPMTDGDDLGREYVGSGDGTVTGPEIGGTVRWDLYEDFGDARCDSHFTGVIRTDDGAEITFEAVGWFVREDPTSESTDWRMVAGVRFGVESPAYAWLNDTEATWHGEMDGDSFRHRYRAFVVD